MQIAGPRHRHAPARQRCISVARARDITDYSRTLIAELGTHENHSISTFINIVVDLLQNNIVTTIRIIVVEATLKQLETCDQKSRFTTIVSSVIFTIGKTEMQRC